MTNRPTPTFTKLVKMVGRITKSQINPIAVLAAQNAIVKGRPVPNRLNTHYQMYQSGLMKGMATNPSFRTAVIKSGLSESYDPPNMMILKRVGIRAFPDGRRVALYINEKTGLSFTIPYTAAGINPNDVPTVNEMAESSLVQILELVSEEVPNINIQYDDEEFSLVIDSELADDMLDVYESLNEENRNKFEEMLDNKDSVEGLLNFISEARVKIVKARIRGGKIQRRKKVANVKGYTMRGGKLTRMSAAERLRRKQSQRRGKIKRRAKAARALMKRKRSLRRRQSLGL